MSINLVKGQKINLSKEVEGLDTVIVGLGWDAVKRGLFRSAPDIDCDAFAIAVDKQGKSIETVYFGNLSAFNGAIHHCGDNLTGDGDGDDEQIITKLNDLPSKVDKIIFAVNIYSCVTRKQDFGMIKNAFIRLVDQKTGKEICKYNLSESYEGKTAMAFAEVYKHNNEWKFNAIGRGTNDISISQFVKNYLG